jgi:hypothetical protein
MNPVESAFNVVSPKEECFMQLRTAVLSAALLPALLLPVLAGESGPKAGWTVQKFEVLDITGPNKGGKPLCYV